MYEEEFTATAQSLLDDTCVNDIQGGGDVEEDTRRFKKEATKILSEGGFTLHKWHSNVEHLNSVEKVCEEEETYTKSLVGTRGNNETKILGTPWDKKHDTLSIDFKTCLKMVTPLTKRKMISTINGVYDILGWSSPVTTTDKLIFSEVCLLKLHWDEEVPNEIQRKWETWVNSLRTAPTITVPWPICKSSHQKTNTVRDSWFLGCEQGGCLCFNVCRDLPGLHASGPKPTCSQIKDRSKRDEHPKTRVGCSAHLSRTPKQREKGVEVLSHLCLSQLGGQCYSAVLASESWKVDNLRAQSSQENRRADGCYVELHPNR